MRILITGGAGFIGANLVRHHLNKGDEVWAFDNLSTGTSSNIDSLTDHAHFTFTAEDILSSPTLPEAVAWSERIYHLAAMVGQKKVIKEPIEVLEQNIEGCSRVLELAAKSSSRILIASSSEVYGPSGKGDFSEASPILFPSGSVLQVNYSLAKFVNEAQGLSYYTQKGVRCTLVRLFNTTGPFQTKTYGMVVPNFVSQALNHEPITVYGDGSQTRSFCDIRDTLEAFDTLAGTEKSVGEIVNVGNDREITILELAHLVKKITQSSSEVVFVPYEKAYGMPFTDVLRRKPCLKKLYALTNYRPKWTLEQTISSMTQKNSL